MNQIMELSRQLNKALLESVEYRTYVNARQHVQGQPELYQAMNSFRQRNRHIQMYASPETIYDEMHQLTEEFKGVLRNSAVEEFLIAEQKLCRMLQNMYIEVGKELEFDDSYMEG